ncbi:hypothetical protein O3P69_020540 [Scylla paramamosain]|uniref:Uncharacterized protein n=1 Tax=Scylla paramamosain TaxID=85552 RepID=A0AAW0TLK0_SCYPA
MSSNSTLIDRIVLFCQEIVTRLRFPRTLPAGRTCHVYHSYILSRRCLGPSFPARPPGTTARRHQVPRDPVVRQVTEIVTRDDICETPSLRSSSSVEEVTSRAEPPPA